MMFQVLVREIIAGCIVCLVAAQPVAAATYSVIYNFQGILSYPHDGAYPTASPAVDGTGQLYVSAQQGSGNESGVFRLTPPSGSSASWTESEIYDFAAAKQFLFCNSGPLLVDGDANIYGDAVSDCGSTDRDIVYRLTPSLGAYAFTEIFLSKKVRPYTGMQFGADGLLYGGADHLPEFSGLLVSIPPDGGTLKSRPAPGGVTSQLSPAFNGRLFYTTSTGGDSGLGTVGMLSTSLNSAPRASVIYSFLGGGDAETPSNSAPVKGSDSAIYGCTLGGAYGYGAIFRLAPPASSQTSWTETVIYSFSPSDVLRPSICAVTAGSAGTLIGALPGGGPDYAGLVFELSPPAQAGGPWTYKVLHDFDSKKGDVYAPVGAPTRVGNSYFGSAIYGGSATYGGIYEVVP